MTTDLAVRVRGLRKFYGQVKAVDGVDLDVARGEIFALLGPNGAGKTTTTEVLEGYRKRDDGDVSVWVRTLRKARSLEVQDRHRAAGDVAFTFLTVAEAVTQFAS